jgi:hypothetical protein
MPFISSQFIGQGKALSQIRLPGRRILINIFQSPGQFLRDLASYR